MCWSKPLQDGAQSFRSHLEAQQGSPALQDSLNPSRPEPIFEAAAQKLRPQGPIPIILVSLVIFDQMCKSQYTRQWLSKNEDRVRHN